MEHVEPGDTVYAACGGAEFHAESDACMPLEEGTEIQVSSVTENRVRGIAEIEGEVRIGWILSHKIQKRDREESVAALKEIDDIRLHFDRHGAVLRIDATNSHFGGDDLKHLKGLYSLETLELSGSRVTNGDLRHLEDLVNLRWLYLDHTSINDDGLLSLRHLVNLEVLALGQTSVRGSGLAHLSHLRNLRVLNLSDCDLQDDSLRHLGRFEGVQTLALQNVPIDGRGLIHLQSMPRLNVLNLCGCHLKPGTLLHLKGAEELCIIRARLASIPSTDKLALKASNSRLTVFE